MVKGFLVPRDPSKFVTCNSSQQVEIELEVCFAGPVADKGVVATAAELIAELGRQSDAFECGYKLGLGPINKTTTAVLHDLRESAYLTDNDRRLAGKRLDDDHAKG